MVGAAPKKINRVDGKGIAIMWHDGGESFISNIKLRQNCPCAHCAEARGELAHDKPLTGKKKTFNIIQSSIDEETKLVQLQAVGNYAVSIAWGDGHTTGIYTFALLHKLAKS